ncbi:ankyrin repeat domain-containing protein [bacterium]|nr:MAG: ankyrin repeat domain-containing protein [bacterium]
MNKKIMTVALLLLTFTYVNLQATITPLHQAARNGDCNEIAHLVESGAYDVNVQHNGCDDADNATPLHHAAATGNYECVEMLLALDADVHAVTKQGATPLHCAAANGHVKCMRMLLMNGADINAKADDSWTPIFSAVGHGQAESLKELLFHGAIAHEYDTDGYSLLRVAHERYEAGKISKECLTILLKHECEFLRSKTQASL